MTPVERMRAAVDYVREHQPDWPFCGPVPEKEIDRVAKKLGVPITGSYREFVRLLGGQTDAGFRGVDLVFREAGVLGSTEVERENDNLPKHYLVVYDQEGLQEGCIMDCSDPQPDGEFPVYSVFFSDWRTARRRIADSFVEFFEHFFGIKAESRRKAAAGPPKTRTRSTTTKGRKTPAKKKSPKRGSKGKGRA